jgi:hypothetical protein
MLGALCQEQFSGGVIVKGHVARGMRYSYLNALSAIA